MRIPAKSELLKAAIHIRTHTLIEECFGTDWYTRGDPRPLLELSFEDIQIHAHKQGLPATVLVENTWSGHEHFVISHQGSNWRVGYAERGNASLISTHQSREEALNSVARELWYLFDLAGNPSVWKGGVAVGTPMPL